MDHKETFVNAGWDPTLVVLSLSSRSSLLTRRSTSPLRGASDTGTLERTAHALKGSCGNLGARKMAETAGLLEKAGRGGDLSAAPGFLHRLDAEFSQTRAELSALLLKG